MQNALSYQFQFVMIMVSTFFWVLNWIPFVNVVTNFIYWLIWLGVFFYKYLPLLRSIVKTGLSISTTGIKIGIISSIAFILGEIPFVSMFPWNVISSWWVNRLIKQLLAKIEHIKKEAEELKGGWNKHWQEYKSPAARALNYKNERDRERGERGFKDPNAVVQ